MNTISRTPAKPRVFISYRRSDSRAWAGRITDFLRHNSNAVVDFDVESIKRGSDYTRVIQEQIAGSDIVLVVIGKQWLEARDSSGRRRLDNPDDPVRLEIKHALDPALGERLVIPVLIEDATIPERADLPEDIGALTVRHGLAIDHDSFERDLKDLIEQDLGGLKSTDTAPSPNKFQASFALGSRMRMVFTLGSVLLVSLAGLAGYRAVKNTDSTASQQAAINAAIDHKLAQYEAQITTLKAQLKSGAIKPPSASEGSCGPGLTVNKNTSCPFAKNVQKAFLSSGKRGGWVSAYSPALKTNFKVYCKVGKPTICSGGNSKQTGVYIF